MLICIMILLATQCTLAQEWTPNFYKPLKDKQTSQMKFALQEIPKLNLKGDESILDIGCGDGAITAHIAKHVIPHGTIHGIDISQAMIEKAMHHTHSNVSFEQISLFEYQPKQQYDVVVCFWTLYLFDDYASAFNQVVSCVKPGGKILIMHLLDPATPYFQLFKDFIAPEAIPLTLPTLESSISAMRNAPVELEYLQVKNNYGRYQSTLDLYEHMKKVPFFRSLSPQEEKQFLTQLSSTYKQEPDGSINDYAHALCIILEKK